MTPEHFARDEYRDYVTYRELAKTETVPEFKRILEALIEHELEDYRFWLHYSSAKAPRISALEIWCLKAMRRVLGLTFTAKFLEGHERDAIRKYTAFLNTVDKALKPRVQEIIDHETHHEKELISQIKEERVKFLGSVVLGINDGLIELTGALVGLSFALRDHTMVALLGAVTGIAASLSMAASAYMQARHEEGRDPAKAAVYTGVAYAVVVAALVLPFALIPNTFAALAVMGGMILLMIAGFSFYSSVLFERRFTRQAGEMLLFSVGVAGVAFLLGSLARSVLSPLSAK